MADITPITEVRAFMESGTTATARTNIGLGSVDDTSDLNKPISTATQLALDSKALATDVAAIEERDWVSLPDSSIPATDPITSWPAGVLSIMYVEDSTDPSWPSNGIVTVDRRRTGGRGASKYSSFTSTNGFYLFRRWASSSWVDWDTLITSTDGTISDDLEFSSTTLTAPNIDSTAPESLVTRADLEAGPSYEITNSSGTVNLDVQNHYIDPTSGDITLTLPNSQLSSSDGKLAMIKRVVNGGNVVNIVLDSGDSMNGNVDSTVILANANEYTLLQALPIIGWQTLNRHLTAYASMAVVTPTTFSATTGFTKLTSWDLDTFSTPQKFEANASSDQLDILHHTGNAFDAYALALNLSVEGIVNKYIQAQIYDQLGNPLSSFVAVNGLGAGKPITITLTTEILVAPSVDSIEVRVLSEDAQTLTISAGSILANRIGG